MTPEDLLQVFRHLEANLATQPPLDVYDWCEFNRKLRNHTAHHELHGEVKSQMALLTGMPINTNLCNNKFIKHKDRTIMLQATSIYTQGNGSRWDPEKMFDIMLDVAKTSLHALGSDLFTQLTEK